VNFILLDETAVLESGSESESDDNPSPQKPKRGRLNVVTPEVAEALDGARISSPDAAMILSAFTASIGGTAVQKTNINVRSIHRKREQLRETRAEETKSSVYKSADPVLTVHWDGKIILALIGSSKNDRQAIIVTGPGTSQFLGAPTVPDGTAEQIKIVVIGTLFEWKLTDRVRCMSFDTTATNSGIYLSHCT
jgi:hypothetical protein